MLKPILDNIAIILTIFAGLFAFFKWMDTRNQNLKNDRYEKYTKLIKVLSGSKINPEQSIAMTEQIASAWLLMEYKEYYDLTLKILDNEDLEKMSNEPWKKFVLPQIKMVIKEIKNKKELI